MSEPTGPDDAPRTTADPARAAIVRTWMIAGLAATMIGFSVAPLLNCYLDRSNKDYGLWFYAGRAFSRGVEIYPEDGRIFPFMYPPSAAAFLAALSFAGEKPFVTVLVLASSVAW